MMAKKKQKDEEKINEEFNEDSFEDISDADDSFGLPDVEMEPLSEVDEPEEKKEEATEEDEAAKEVVGDEDETDNAAEVEQEVEASGEDYSYKEPGEFEGSDETETAEQSVEKGETSTYVPPKQESIMPKLLIFAAILIVAGLAVWYFLFYKP